MRMAGPDIILFVIGAVLFAGAGYGLVATGGNLGGSSSALGVYDVSYTTAVSDVETQNVANFGGTRDLTFAVDEHAVSKVIVTLTCTDPAGALAPFTLTVDVTGPNGEKGSGNGACGQAIEVTVDVAPVPPNTVVQGRDDAEARENLGDPGTPMLAHGDWLVKVSGARGAGGGALPAGNPGGSVKLAVEQWTPKFDPIQA